LALIVTLISVGLIGARPEVRRNVLILLATTVAALFLATAVFDLDANSFGRLGVFYTLATADTTAIQGTLSQSSFGARIEMWSKTIELIPNAPFGIGLGAWDRVVDTRLPTPYPHNLFLELWSEGGIILGSFAAIPFLMFLFAPRKIFWFVAFCLFLAQMISGDIADARFLMVFGFLAFFSRREPDAIGEEVLQPEIFDSALQPRAAN
jgi:O-antigen ligase